MRVGLFGGSFDPIHEGHVRPVLEARRALDLSRVIYLPTAMPPHKTDRRFAPAAARYTMVELALLELEGMEVSDFELTPGERAYSIDSIEHFGRTFAGADLVLLIGEDSLLELSSWHRWREIVSRVELGVLARSGFEADRGLESLPDELREAQRQGRLHLIENEPVAASSTDLRCLLAEGRELPRGVVPPLVLEYLQKYPHLYA